MSEDEEPQVHRLPRKISIDLGDNPGLVEFENCEEILEWASKQQNWSITHCRKMNNHPKFVEIYDRQELPSATLQAIANDVISGEREAAGALPEIETELTRYREHEAVHGEGPIGSFLESLGGEGWELVGGLVAAIGHPPFEFVGSFHNQQLGSFAGGYILMQLAFPQLRDKEAESVRVALNNMLTTEANRFNAQHSEQQTKIQELHDKGTAMGDEAVAQKAALDALQTQYNEFMKLESPASYWNDRAVDSGKLALWWTVAFGVIALAGVVGAVYGYPPILKEFQAKDGSLGAGTIGLMTAPAAILLTTLALLFRNIAGLQKDRTTANERYTMIMTYIAFTGDENAPIDQEHRKHILDRMFTPTTENNATKDTPHPYIDALRQLREAGQDK